MTVECAYRSSHPDVLVWWEEINAARETFRARCAEIVERFPGYSCVTSDRSSGQRLVGITGWTDDEGFRRLAPPPSDAWRRMDRDVVHYVPYRNHRRDDELVALFDDVHWKMTTPPGGMPLKLMAEGGWYSPGIRSDEDREVWFSWGVGAVYIDPDPELADKVLFRDATAATVDTELWQSAKLSEFYAAQGR